MSFIHELTWADLPPVVQQQARRCLLDTMGAALGGRKTDVSAIIYDYAATVYGGVGARLWWDGRRVSPPGAALAHAMTIDALDISAALLAQKGFTGAPAVTVEYPEAAPFWQTLGVEWEILGQYVKPHAVCRWAQPAIEAAIALQQQYRFPVEAIQQVTVHTFHQAARLNMRRPQDSDQAQYSLPFPVAAALVYGKLGGSELTGAALVDPTVLALVDKVVLVEDETSNAHFPARRFAEVTITTTDGQSYQSPATEACWNHHDPPTDEELLTKFRWLATELLSPAAVNELENALWHCAEAADMGGLVTQTQQRI